MAQFAFDMDKFMKHSTYICIMGAAIAQWIRLYLPSSGPEFKSQAHHLCNFHDFFDQ